jgi:hypothetical protein
MPVVVTTSPVRPNARLAATKRQPRPRRTRCSHYQGALVIWTVGTLFGSVRARLLDPIGANLLINQVHTKRRPTNRRPS